MAPTLRIFVALTLGCVAASNHKSSLRLAAPEALGSALAPVTGLVEATPPEGSSVLTPASIAWLHVPKAGTSFANVLVTWGCPTLPDDSVVNDSYSNGRGQFVPGFMQAHQDNCEAGMRLCGAGHVPVRKDGTCNDWEQHKGSFVALFRQPEQRALSGFNHHLHDVHDKSLDLPSYARRVAGCSVRMINGFHCGDPSPITDAMQATAMRRLDEGFAFVGLTGDWARSVCLFHLMHGGPCHRREFLDVRPGAKHDADYDTSGLQGWTDPYDGPLYERAATLFAANVKKYKATDEACQRLCPQSNGAFAGGSVEARGKPVDSNTAKPGDSVDDHGKSMDSDTPKRGAGQATALAPKKVATKKPEAATALAPEKASSVFESAFDEAMAAADVE